MGFLLWLRFSVKCDHFRNGFPLLPIKNGTPPSPQPWRTLSYHRLYFPTALTPDWYLLVYSIPPYVSSLECQPQRSQTLSLAPHCLAGTHNSSWQMGQPVRTCGLKKLFFFFSIGYKWPISTKNNDWAGTHREGVFPAGTWHFFTGVALFLLALVCTSPEAGSLLLFSWSSTCRGQWVSHHFKMLLPIPQQEWERIRRKKGPGIFLPSFSWVTLVVILGRTTQGVF